MLKIKAEVLGEKKGIGAGTYPFQFGVILFQPSDKQAMIKTGWRARMTR